MNIQEVLSERREQRREFMLAARRYGFTAAVIGLGGGFLTDRQAMAQTMADDQGDKRSSVLPMGSLYEGALFVLFEVMILKLVKMLTVTPEAMRANHTNLE